MDLSQTKLTKSEWVSVEIPVSDQEKRVLSLILDGYANPDIRRSRHLSLLAFTKVDASEEMEYFLYKTYFLSTIEDIAKSGSVAADEWLKSSAAKDRKIKTPNKADSIRIKNLESQITNNRKTIFDFVLLDYVRRASSSVSAVYTLIKFRRLSIEGINRFLLSFVDYLLESANKDSPAAIRNLVHNATQYIEKNRALMEYDDDTLYTHQRDLFRLFSTNRSEPKCVLYMAPTGTGKTLSPIGLSQQYRVLFVCAARHVGLALAKSAISVGKRVAFAFGCETAADIRLHYFAAADYTINKRSGGIHRVDNSNGTRVEIMICDVASYLVAMYYMKCFNSVGNMVMYWDEPTIGMDKQIGASENPESGSDLHKLIHDVWSKNQIPNVVLSCATLPKPDEIGAALHDFRAKFVELDGEPRSPEIHVIDSHDCKKTISILGKDGRIALPHLLFPEYRDLMNCVEHCETNKSLLRYFDVQEIVRLIEYVQPIIREDASIEHRFKSIDSISLHSLKQYYLFVLVTIPPEKWPHIYQYMTDSLKPRFSKHPASACASACASAYAADIRKIKSVETSGYAIPKLPMSTEFSRQNSVSITTQTPISKNPSDGILLTTSDAHTLTDGPTIYLAEDVEKVGRFYLQQSKIPESVFKIIQEKIDKNNLILKRVRQLEQEYEAKTATSSIGGGGDKDKGSKKAEKEPASKDAQKLLEQIKGLREAMQTVHLNAVYIPNTKQHLELHARETMASQGNQSSIPFTPNVDEEDVRQIMALEVENQQKLLLILGIGVFSKSTDHQYAEIMKRLAYGQKLYLIIASSDYIYGTNYQFCHGFIGKDLANMTQQKTIQAIGRIGRNNIQQEYTVRFRDDDVLMRLFKRATENLEAETMNRLFSSEDDL